MPEIGTEPAAAQDDVPSALGPENAVLRQELQLARARIVELEAALGDAASATESLIATVSHELRTPLGTLSMGVEAITRRVRNCADEVPAEWLVQRLGRLHRAVGRIDQLLATFLSAAQLQAGRIVPAASDADLVEIVRQLVEQHADALAWAGCACTVVGAPCLEGRWDPVHVEQIVANLLGNAMKYAPGQPIEIAIEREGAEACIHVRDHGPGIEPGDRERLFERFVRLPSATRVTGFGLGLWIARHLAEVNGGGVSVDSCTGAGTTFTVRLPLQA